MPQNISPKQEIHWCQIPKLHVWDKKMWWYKMQSLSDETWLILLNAIRKIWKITNVKIFSYYIFTKRFKLTLIILKWDRIITFQSEIKCRKLTAAVMLAERGYLYQVRKLHISKTTNQQLKQKFSRIFARDNLHAFRLSKIF